MVQVPAWRRYLRFWRPDPAADVGVPPLRVHEAALLQPVQRGVERAVEDAERVARRLADPPRDAVAVPRPPAERLQHQHVERAEQDVELAIVGHGASIPSAVDGIKG